MPTDDDPDRLQGELRDLLARGPTSAVEAARRLGISQAAFSRLIARSRPEVLVTGRARATRYLAYREIADVGRVVPMFDVDESGSTRRLGLLHGVRPRGFWLESFTPDADSGFFEDLPYFLYELRPSGFLGRLLPRRHPELDLPDNVEHWTGDHALRYAARYGWNLPGNVILGDEAFQRFLAHLATANDRRPSPDRVAIDQRTLRYPELAENVMAAGMPGSSAAGEQPKFLVERTPPPTAVLVKFSPPAKDATSGRLADLLVAEHVALESMRAHGHDAARSQLLMAGGRVFLEVERFDRLPGGGRRGLLSLLALDAELVGRLQSWNDSMAGLAALGQVDDAMVAEVRWRQLFGRLIANSDMHGGNLSFFMRGARVVSLAPAYDMGPALYAPAQGHLREPPFQPPLPEPADAPLWEDACTAAEEVWATLSSHPSVSRSFRSLAATNAAAVARARGIGKHLPR